MKLHYYKELVLEFSIIKVHNPTDFSHTQQKILIEIFRIVQEHIGDLLERVSQVQKIHSTSTWRENLLVQDEVGLDFQRMSAWLDQDQVIGVAISLVSLRSSRGVQSICRVVQGQIMARSGLNHWGSKTSQVSLRPTSQYSPSNLCCCEVLSLKSPYFNVQLAGRSRSQLPISRTH